MKIIVVAGMLAAGKSVALRFFQDRGFYCVDNLPPKLIDTFIDLLDKSEPKTENIAIVLDARGSAFFDDIDEILDNLKNERGADILYIDADDDVLISRYKKNRRKHLISGNDRIEVAIKKERKSMEEVKKRADLIIDTSKLLERDFEKILHDCYGKIGTVSSQFSINISSFGFKYGILHDADIVYDVRFLPNPFYIKDLKPLTGKNKEVSDYVFSFDESKEFMDKLEDIIAFTIPYYIKEGKAQLVIGIGCTGGRHRSVAIAGELAKRIEEKGYIVTEEHRDISKDNYQY
ncbi:RNase adapter RapZ [Anaerofustis stercorihominis]|uniref:RNase adapter RapZ n=1 Tax=Anaerofustis stercorihominis TaxID=214853 RepID=UPI00214D07EB|nr:RNase adapter RapZ [Anaerofustis stercorihominis]MCR2033797.1 RNase adapter RapZ [Anaerofustis stercorihominis]